MNAMTTRRLALVIAVGAAWLLSSNHCTITALVKAKATPAHACCADKAPAPAPCANQCCTVLTASLPGDVNSLSGAVGLQVIAIIPDQTVKEPSSPRATFECGLAPPRSQPSFYTMFELGTTVQPTAPPRSVA